MDRGRMVMTIGNLSRRTGVPVKALRQYEDMGLVYTAGRSAGNYRLSSTTRRCGASASSAVCGGSA
jgi:MerR family regulatory protein